MCFVLKTNPTRIFQASVRRPIQLFVEVKLNGVPILDAKVKVFFEVSFCCEIVLLKIMFSSYPHMHYFFPDYKFKG